MTALTQPAAPRISSHRHHTATQAALSVCFWTVAATTVAFTHQHVGASAPVACAALEVIAIVVMAGAYVRLAAPFANLDHALFTGTAWLLLAIATEIIVRMTSGHPWFALLGSPAHGGLRCVLLIAWVIAPALFVNGDE